MSNTTSPPAIPRNKHSLRYNPAEVFGDARIHPADVMLIDEWIAGEAKADATKAKYRTWADEFALWLQARHGIRLTQVRGKHVERFMAWLMSDQRGELSASSRKGAIAALKRLYRWLVRIEEVEFDPTSAVERPRVVTTPGLTITPEQVRLFLDAPGKARERVVAYFLVFLAARIGDLRGLLWSQVDLGSRIVHLTGKGGKTVAMPLHPALFLALKEWQAIQAREAERNDALRVALADPQTAFVFLSRNGRQLASSTFWKHVKWRAARAGILPHPDGSKVGSENTSALSPHALRRSWATIMRNNGVSLEDIADGLRHQYVDTTRRHYAFTEEPTRRRTMNSFQV